jgi:hypothetical protein
VKGTQKYGVSLSQGEAEETESGSLSQGGTSLTTVFSLLRRKQHGRARGGISGTFMALDVDWSNKKI